MGVLGILGELRVTKALKNLTCKDGVDLAAAAVRPLDVTIFGQLANGTLKGVLITAGGKLAVDATIDEDLATNVDTLNTSVGTLDTDVNTLDTDVKALDSAIDAAKTSVEALTTALAGPVMSATHVHAPNADTAAVVTYAGVAATKHSIQGVAFSYDDTPAGGNLTITDDNAEVFNIDIATKGHGVVMFPKGYIQAVANKTLLISLHAGGGVVKGKVSVIGYEAIAA